jgi:hypothetical protein
MTWRARLLVGIERSGPAHCSFFKNGKQFLLSKKIPIPEIDSFVFR